MSGHESLNGKTAVITGGAGVLCSSFAYALAKQGVRVALLGRTEEKVKAEAERITAAGGKAAGIKCDVTDRESVENARRKVNEIFGKCDILINGAGGNHPKGTTTKEIYDEGDIDIQDGKFQSFFSLAPSGFEYVFGLNIMGTLIPAQVFMQDMLGRSGACVINISSMSAYSPMTKVPAYSAAKSAVSNFTQWLAVHFAKSGIRINAIAPGFFETAQNKALLRNEDGSLTERSGKIISQTPMGRFGRPEDLNGTLLWLCDSSESGFVTGITVAVDGGFSAYSGV